ncbi:MAG TPA: small ribosomal subunit Rsm22 family protein [Candidatus Angelobacter sp.]
MHLPPELAEAIQQETENVDRAALAQAAADLTQHYRAGHFSALAIKTGAHRAAYLAVRFPATYAASWHAFSEARRLAPEAEIKSILDLGAGPGTAVCAASEVFPLPTRATMVEADPALIALGKRITAQSPHPAVRNANWLKQDIKRGLFWEPHDLVVASYMLDELPLLDARRTVLAAWQYTKQFLMIVEPGTMRGFTFVDLMRSMLIGAGAQILAPCPHSAQCPMALAGDWCHFAARVERTPIHRLLKGGTLGHEDEKFSYVVFSRTPLATAAARIVRHPQKHSGHVQLSLCTPHGLRIQTIGKSQKGCYKLARAAAWGDPWKDDPDSHP